MDHLLLITIGPVQEFIQSARRTRDLWFGSWLLSALARSVAQSLIAQTNAEALISPAAQSIAASGDVPNQILARVGSDPKAIADECHKALIACLDDLFTRTGKLNTLREPQRDIAKQQIHDAIDYQWVALPYPAEAEYAVLHKKLRYLSEARKHTRTFTEIPWHPQPGTARASVFKSSLDGSREMVMDGDKPGEVLSGIDALKRYALPQGQESGFPSTSHMAALPFGKRLIAFDPQAKDGWLHYVERLDSRITHFERVPRRFTDPLFGIYDGSLLFESRLGEDLDPKTDMQAIRTARGHLADFLRAHTKNENSIPIPYYAILVADGDHMGKVIDTKHSPDDHRNFSQDLADFAATARNRVETRHQGAVIYAGGDDLLAFVPLHTVLDCAEDIQRQFSAKITYSDPQTRQDVQATLSVGIAVVHHLDMLSDALECARKAEKQAKKPRNALAITVSKRSGTDRTSVGSWDSTFFSDLQRLIGFHASEQIPDGFAYEIRNLAQRLPLDKARDHAERDAWITIRALEVERMLARKYTSAGKKVDDETLKILTAIHQRYLSQDTLDDALDCIATLHIIASEFAAARRLAEGE